MNRFCHDDSKMYGTCIKVLCYWKNLSLFKIFVEGFRNPENSVTLLQFFEPSKNFYNPQEPFELSNTLLNILGLELDNVCYKIDY